MHPFIRTLYFENNKYLHSNNTKFENTAKNDKINTEQEDSCSVFHHYSTVYNYDNLYDRVSPFQ